MKHSQHEFTYRKKSERAWLAAVGAWVALLTATVGAVAQLPGAPAAGWRQVADATARPFAVGEPVPPSGASGPARPVDAGVPAESTPASSTPAETRKEPERGGRPLRPIRSRDGGSTDYWQPRARKLPA